MTVSLWQDSASWPGELPHETITADIAIVGGGVVGATLATLLVQAGKDVVVLESGTIGGGASGRNGGHCFIGLRNDYHRAIELLGHDAAKQLRTQLTENRSMVRAFCDQFTVPYIADGSQYLGIDAEDREDMQASARALQADGFEVEYEELGGPHGHGDERGFRSRLFQPGDMALQPYILVTRMMAASGARVEENCEVRTIEQLANGGVRLQARRITVECGEAILATNAYSRILHPYFRDKVFPTRGQIFVTEPTAAERVLPIPTGSTEEGRYFYYRQLPDGRVLIGGNRKPFLAEEQTYGDEVNLPLQESMHGWLAQHYPELADLRITHRWAGILGYSVDAMPLIGRLPDMPSVAFAVGFTGSGMSYGPLAARMTAEYLLEGRHPGPYHVDRLDNPRAQVGGSLSRRLAAAGYAPAPAAIPRTSA